MAHPAQPRTTLRTGNVQIDALVERVRWFLEHDTASFNVMGKLTRGYRSPDTPAIWIRDHSDMLRGAKYWETDMTSAVERFAETQTADGWLFDYFTMVPEKVPCERENWLKFVRVPVEADVEYRFVKALYLAWQATGDQAWMRRMLPHAERAMRYVLSDPWRWDPSHKLIKRAYTMDTWDFDYTAGRHDWLNFQVTDETFWGIMHGDSSGYYEAFRLLARMYGSLGQHARAKAWETYAAKFRRRANAASFNGTFYRHRVPLVPGSVEGVDEEAQLTLSNPMDINRGLADHGMAVSILREYQRRGESSGALAEWFSVDPPFPAGIFGDEKIIPGMYCNGGIMPLVGGELARAAFEHGLEEYGCAQLFKYEQLTRDRTTFLWYFPDGRPSTIETSTSPDAMPTDGWGSSAMLYALIEGLAGIEDLRCLFRTVRLSPRWISAGCAEVEASVSYAASGAGLAYSYVHRPEHRTIALEVRGDAEVAFHLQLPAGTRPSALRVDGRTVRHRAGRVEQSSYADAAFTVRGRTNVIVEYR
jgi:hypothetical protein